ncbi:MAG: molybdenum cofactor guanylyltransferase MobA [Lautropia sp.]|nr:molybdenum cofactor guanylyltransferase MobA [Lautropia sp.]
MSTFSQSPPAIVPLTGLVLAGGAARRMQTGGHAIDKGLLRLGSHPLVLWQTRTLAPQVSRLLISANRHLAWYRRWGYPVIPDHFPDQPGPLAGIHAGLLATKTDWLAVTACDTPFLPPGWATRLLAAARQAARPLAFAVDANGQEHPLVAVMHRSLLPGLSESLNQSQHRVRAFYQQHDALVVPFEDDTAFFNINTPDAWQEATRIIMSAASSNPAEKPENTQHGQTAQTPVSLIALEAAEAGFNPQAVPVALARALIARYVPTPVEAETVCLADAVGRILASTIDAPFDVPSQDNAAMDGYALRHADLCPTGETRLQVAGRTLAGDAPAPTLAAGHAQRIMTGAPMPMGADTVVMQEDVRLIDRANEACLAGTNANANANGAGTVAAAGAGREAEDAGRATSRMNQPAQVADGTMPAVPELPETLSIDLLRRRPDVRAAERRVAAANANLGIAQGAWLPDLSFNSALALGADTLSDLIASPLRTWSLGSQLAAVIFDGGTRRAELSRQEAAYDETVAAYRQQVLTAVQEIEDYLLAHRTLALQLADQARLVSLAEASERVVRNRYRSGLVNYLELATAQRLTINSQEALLNLQAERLAVHAGLLAALGGRW